MNDAASTSYSSSLDSQHSALLAEAGNPDSLTPSGSSGLPDHTMVESVRGPRYCCRECSLRRGSYVEWPCPARFLATCALLGSLMDVRDA